MTLDAQAVEADTCSSVLCDRSVARAFDVVDGVVQAQSPDAASLVSQLTDALPRGWLTRDDRAAIARTVALDGQARVTAAATSPRGSSGTTRSSCP